jgi:hypothetical protein
MAALPRAIQNIECAIAGRTSRRAIFKPTG